MIDFRFEAASFFQLQIEDNFRERKKLLADYLSIISGLYANEVGPEAAREVLLNIASALNPNKIYQLQITHTLDLDVLCKQVAALYGLDAADLILPTKRRIICRARQHFMHSAYSSRRYTYVEIAVFLHRDHTTVVHGVLRHQDLLDGKHTPAHELRRRK